MSLNKLATPVIVLFAAANMSLTMPVAASAADLSLAELQKMTERFAPVELRVDTAKLSSGDRAALVQLIEASRVLNRIFLEQMWTGNLALERKLRADSTALGKARLEEFLFNKGPWSDLDEHKAFLPGVPERKPMGAAFYPEDMTREQFEAWAKTLTPQAREQAEGFLR